MCGRRRWLSWILVFFLAAVLVNNPGRAMQFAYRVVHDVSLSVPVFANRQWLIEESSNFRLYYSDSDQAIVAGVLADLEDSLVALSRSWPDQSQRRIAVFLYPSVPEMQGALGDGENPTLGAYRLGRLHLLSPSAWQPQLSAEAAVAFYAEQGPAVHELVHLLLDREVAGNGPLWFSEGLAQYWEREIKGYLWMEPGVDWQDQVVTISQLDQQFNSGSGYFAYRQSLAVVEYLYDVYGDSAVEQIVIELSKGRAMEESIYRVLGVDWVSFEAEWRMTCFPWR